MPGEDTFGSDKNACVTRQETCRTVRPRRRRRGYAECAGRIAVIACDKKRLGRELLAAPVRVDVRGRRAFRQPNLAAWLEPADGHVDDLSVDKANVRCHLDSRRRRCCPRTRRSERDREEHRSGATPPQRQVANRLPHNFWTLPTRRWLHSTSGCFESRAGESRTRTGADLNRVPLPLGYGPWS